MGKILRFTTCEPLMHVRTLSSLSFPSSFVNWFHTDGHCGRLTRLPDSFRAHCGDPASLSLSDLRFSFVTIHLGSSEDNSQCITHHNSEPWVTESMSVLADPATYGLLNSELTNCPRTAAVLGELLAQWQQMMGTLQRVEQEAVSSQSLANAIESIGRTRTEATAGRLRLKDGERLYPKSWSGSTTIGGFAREVAAWLGYIDPTHEAGKLIQRITKGTLRASIIDGIWNIDEHGALPESCSGSRKFKCQKKAERPWALSEGRHSLRKRERQFDAFESQKVYSSRRTRSFAREPRCRSRISFWGIIEYLVHTPVPIIQAMKNPTATITRERRMDEVWLQEDWEKVPIWDCVYFHRQKSTSYQHTGSVRT